MWYVMFDIFKDFNFDFTGFKCYHISPYDFNLPDYDEILIKRKERTTHSNSYLGLWASTLPECYASNKDAHIYEITFKPSAIIKFILFGDFVKFCQSATSDQFYIDTNQQVKGYVDCSINLDNWRGGLKFSEIIIYNLNCIDKFVKIDKIPRNKEIFINLGEQDGQTR